MIGKFSKLAQGHFQTHVAGNQVDVSFLADIAGRCGGSLLLQAEIRRANTARHVQEIVEAAGLPGYFDVIAADVAQRSHTYVQGALTVEAIMFDFDGTILGRAQSGVERVGD
jgi:cobalt-precorrin-5B (C1)-methyltransferase